MLHYTAALTNIGVSEGEIDDLLREAIEDEAERGFAPPPVPMGFESRPPGDVDDDDHPF